MNTQHSAKWTTAVHVAKMAPGTGAVAIDSETIVAIDSELKKTEQQRDELLAELELAKTEAHNKGVRIQELHSRNAELLAAASELVSIVKIHSKATDNNFAWAEVQVLEEAIAKARGQKS